MRFVLLWFPTVILDNRAGMTANLNRVGSVDRPVGSEMTGTKEDGVASLFTVFALFVVACELDVSGCFGPEKAVVRGDLPCMEGASAGTSPSGSSLPLRLHP